MALSNYYEIEQEAKKIYGINAAKEMCEHWGVPFNERTHKIKCRFHNDEHPSWDWNSKDCCFHCFSCPPNSEGRNYGIIDFYINEYKLTYWQALKKLCDNAGVEFEFNNERINKVPEDYKYPTKENGDRTKVEEYLIEKRGISKETLDYADVTASNDGEHITFNIYDINNKLMGVKYRIARAAHITDGKKEARFWWQSGTTACSKLFNMNRCNPNSTLYITEGMIDALSVIEAGKKNVVSIPGGVSEMKWVYENKEWLDSFKHIVLWVDSDTTGLDYRDRIIRLLGAHRTDYIEITDTRTDKNGNIVKIKDANELLLFKGKERLQWYLDNPIEPPMEGLLYLGDCEPFDFEKAEGWYTGIKDLDNLLKKGLFSTFNVISGFRSSGKSTWINQLICNWVDQGYPTFVFSGELPPHKLMSWLEICMAGRENIEINNAGYRQIIPAAIPKMRKWYRESVIYFDKMRMEPTPDNLLERIEYSVKKCGVRMVIIDNLMTMSFHCKKEEELDKQKEFCDKLIQLAHTYELAVFLVDHPIKVNVPLMEVDHIRGTGNITNLADYIFIVQRYRASQDPKMYPKNLHPEQYDNIIRLVKNRQEGDEDDIEVYFDSNSRRYYRDAKTELYKRFSWDDNPNPVPTTDPNVHGALAKVKREIQ